MADMMRTVLRLFVTALFAGLLWGFGLIADINVHAQQPGKIPPPTKTPSLPVPPKAPIPQLPPTPSDYLYTAETNEVAKRQGLVKLGNFSWGCQGMRCMAKSTAPTPDVAGCKALAEQIGQIKAYGHPAKQLNVEELKQCNVGVAAATGLGTPPTPPPGVPVGVTPRTGTVYKPGPSVRVDFEGRQAKPTGPLTSRYTPGAPVRIDFEGRQAKSAAPPPRTYVPGPPVRVDFEGNMARPAASIP